MAKAMHHTSGQDAHLIVAQKGLACSFGDPWRPSFPGGSIVFKSENDDSLADILQNPKTARLAISGMFPRVG